jgi:hypothetical protein
MTNATLLTTTPLKTRASSYTISHDEDNTKPRSKKTFATQSQKAQTFKPINGVRRSGGISINNLHRFEWRPH